MGRFGINRKFQNCLKEVGMNGHGEFFAPGGGLLFGKVGVSPLSIYPDFESWPLLVGFCFDPSFRVRPWGMY